jgi:hypothetical protein
MSSEVFRRGSVLVIFSNRAGLNLGSKQRIFLICFDVWSRFSSTVFAQVL